MRVYRQRSKPKRGYAFLTIILLSSLFLGLAGAIASQVLTNQNATKTRLSTGLTRFAAYSGIQEVLLKLKSNPNWGITDAQQAELTLVLMPGSSDTSYSICLTNNLNPRDLDSLPTGITSGENGALIAPDKTIVPAGSIYCVSMGAHAGKDGVTLHAVTGMLGHGKPVLSQSVASDSSLSFTGNSKTFGFQPNEVAFELSNAAGASSSIGTTQTGRAEPTSATASKLNNGVSADVSSNREAILSDTAQIGGKVSVPTDRLGSVNSGHAQSVETLGDPVFIPKFSAPAAANSTEDFTGSSLQPGLSTTQGTPTTGNTVTTPAAENGTTQTDGNQSTFNPVANTTSPGAGGPTVYKSLTIGAGQTTQVASGAYYFPDGVTIDGTLKANPTLDTDGKAKPIIFYVGKNFNIGSSGLVNAGGSCSDIQIYFVDSGTEATTQEFSMVGSSQFFGCVVGGRVEANLQDQAQLYGAFAGHSFKASGNAQVYFDKSLANKTLAVSTDIGLVGATEPRPTEILSRLKTALTPMSNSIQGVIDYAADPSSASAPQYDQGTLRTRSLEPMPLSGDYKESIQP